MGRLNQLSPGAYRSGGVINDEFASIIRYLVAAERGNKTLGELMTLLFDSTGTLTAPVEIRLDSTAGLQYRSGTYGDETSGWLTIVDIASLRGAAGVDFGTIEGPLFSGATDIVATTGQTVFSYTFDESDDVLVYVDGVLQAAAAYTLNATNDTVTFDVGVALNSVVHLVRVRASSVSNYRRSDLISIGQAVFPFVHTAQETLQVYRNGLLQRVGGSYDYTATPASNTITFTSTIPAADLVTILTVENIAEVQIAGLMTEDDFVNDAGLIRFDRLAIDNDDIPQAKVSGLAALLANRGHVFVSATTPTGMVVSDIWFDTSLSPTVPKFYDGAQWLRFSPDNTLPSFTVANHDQSLHINGSGTALVWRAVDLSSYVPLSSVGAASGVASLDSSGRLPPSQLPTVLTLDSLYDLRSGSVSDGNYVIKRIYKEIVRIDARSMRCVSGTATVTLQVDGVDVSGTAVAVSSTPSEANYTDSISIDANGASKTIGFKVASAASLNDLEIVLAIAKEDI